jgi:type I restriction enzyme S subunit
VVAVESQRVSSGYLVQRPRWDFRYYDPKYLEVEYLLEKGKYPVKPLAELVRQIVNFGAYSLCNLLVWVDEGVPYLRVTDLKEWGIEWSSVPRIPTEIHEQLPKSKVQPGDVLYSMAGTIGLAVVAPEDLGECNSNQAIAQIRLKAGIDPHYLAVFLNTRLGRYQSERIANGQTVLDINMGEIGKIRIPIPSPAIQSRIAAIMQEAYTTRRAMLAEAEALLGGIDGYVLGELGIDLERAEEQKYFWAAMRSLVSKRLDVEFNMGFHKYDPYPDLVRPVRDVATFSAETTDPTKLPDQAFKYVDIASIDTDLGEIGQVNELPGRDAPNRARKVVHSNELLVSTVRPTRRAVAIVPPDLDGQVCSTGFAVLRARENVSPEYLHVALRLAPTAEQFGRYTTGSSYPAILEKDIARTLIPIPPLDQQQGIAKEVIRRWEQAKKLRHQAEDVVAKAKAQVERMILEGPRNKQSERPK